MKKLLDFFKKEFTDDAVELRECLQLLSECIDGTVQNISKKAAASFGNRDFDKMQKYQQCVTEIDALQVKLESYMSLLDLDNADEYQEEVNEKSTSTTDKKINYADYAVDENTEHSLIEDFTHKRPAGFKLSGNRVIANDWKDICIKTCELLANQNSEIFRSFVDDEKMQGKRVEYFSKSSSGIRKPELIKSAKIYVTTNLSANGIRNIIQLMLRKYSIPTTEYKIYLKADYTKLHK